MSGANPPADDGRGRPNDSGTVSDAQDRMDERGPGVDDGSRTDRDHLGKTDDVPAGVGPEGESTSREDRTAAPLTPITGEVLPTEHPHLLPLETVGVRHGMFGGTGTGDTSGYGGLVRQVAFPHSSEPPYGGYFDEVVDNLRRALVAGDLAYDDAIESIVAYRGELTFYVRRHAIVDVCRRLRDDPALRFEFCSDVSGVHFPGDTARELQAVYHLLSMTHNRRIRLVVACPDSDPHIPSVFPVYPTADWHERETYDFFGIIFDGHPALARIEMPDDWPGHPQRKDYPLGGIPVDYRGASIPPPDQRRAYT